MSKFVGVKNNRIKVISNTKFGNPELTIMELPARFESMSQNDLMLNLRYKDGQLVDKRDPSDIRHLKIALVSNYGMNCGIATYSQFLYDALIPQLGDYKIFAESFSDHPDDSPYLQHCWRRGENLTHLIRAIKEYDPDVVFIQHEWGLWQDSRQWISMMSQLWNYRIIVTMHSTFYHKDKTIVEASIPEIVVHLNSAKNVLQNVKNISSKIHVIPHGCPPVSPKEKIWNFYKTKHNFIQFGFLFRYKGFENSIRAAALLKSKYPDIYFTGLCSENQFALIEHESYYIDLLDLVQELHLEEHVGLIRGYQDNSVIDTFIQMNKAAVFPYVSSKDHECFGSSGAVPYTMSKQLPIISSNVHHFEELPTLKAETPEQIAAELDRLFSDKQAVISQVERQNQYLNEYNWQHVATLYASVLANKKPQGSYLPQGT